MKTLKVKSDRPVMLQVTFYAWGNAILAIKGKEKGKSATPYFDRKYGTPEKPLSGRVTLKFPMPDKFETLGLQVSNVLNYSAVKIEKIEAEELPRKDLAVKQATKDFIKFAADFARKLGELKTDKYISKDGKFQIHLLSEIRDHITGELIPTPARCNHLSGVIEVSKKDFAPMTVANRLYILLHEYAHLANNTDNELECDMLAAKTLMELGYSAIECLYSVSKLFMYNMHIQPSQKAEQERRVKQIKDFINKFGIR